MSLINFALDELGTEISCDKVSSDGYEPRNLLRSTLKRGWTQNGGFLAERFIKPPVTLTLRFACPVNISHIVLDPQVGSQRSSTIEIYTAVQQGKRPSNHSNACRNSVHHNGMDTSKDHTNNADMKNVSAPEPVFKKIGSIQCAEKGRVCFRNPSFQSNHTFTTDIVNASFPYNSELRHHQWFMLASVDLLSVRIVWTASGSVVALGQLEVWALPARSCSPQLRSEMFTRFARASGQLPQQSSSNSTRHELPSCEAKRETSGSLENAEGRLSDDQTQESDQRSLFYGVSVPDEFLDPLTCEIMSSPMILPSGHSVDLSTLDKFADVEASHGRQPSDPFTGVTFTSSRYPLPNSSLKMRIDRFLLEHIDEPSLQNIPRSVGFAPGKHKAQDTSDNTKSLKVEPSESLHTGLKNAKYKQQNAFQNGQPSLGSKRQHAFTVTQRTGDTEVSPSAKRPKVDKVVINHEPSCSTHIPGQTSDSKLLDNESHEARLKASLQDSLSMVLKGSLSSTSVSLQANAETKKETCVSCSVKLKQSISAFQPVPDTPFYVYQLPCEHLMCRTCLVGDKNSQVISCPGCHKEFTKASIVRKHV